jgi:hypothetical protein
MDRWSRSLIGQLCLRKLFRIGEGKNRAAAPDRLLHWKPNLISAPGSDNALIAKAFSPARPVIQPPLAMPIGAKETADTAPEKTRSAAVMRRVRSQH